MEAPHAPGFVIRPIRVEDAVAWASYACLPEVKDHTSSTANSVDDVLRVIHLVLAAEANSPIHFAVTPEHSSALVATVGFHTVSALNRTAEITYDVAPSHWGQGIAKALCRAATLWGFETKDWCRIQATTVLANTRSMRVLEHCGFKREGRVRNFRIVRGAPADYWLYSAVPGEVR